MSTDGGAVAGADALSTADIEQIRAGLGAGRRPKVVFTTQAGQIAGQVGRVVRLADPAESEEWVVVQFGRDELPFSPADLAVPARGSRGQKARGQKGQTPKETRMDTDTDTDTDAGAGAGGASAADSGGQGGTGGQGTGKGKERQHAPKEPQGAQPAAESGKAAKATKAAKSTKAAKPKAPPAMTVQLAYEGGEWTVAAYQGSKTLAKPYVVRPAEALQIVSMVDVPGVHEAVSQIVEAERTEAQRRAESLRSELAEVEARLAELQNSQ